VRAAAGSGAVGLTVLVLGLGAGVLLALSEFSTLYSVEVVTATCEDLADPSLKDTCVVKGGEQHSYGLLVLAGFCALMAWGAGVGASRPAAFALAAAGVVALAITLFGDLPDTSKTGAVGATFAEAEAQKGSGVWLQLMGGAAALAAGALRIRFPRRD
jgi:hypothetical protein